MKNYIKYFFVSLFSIVFFNSSAFADGHKYSGPDLSGQKVVISGPWLAPEDGYMREIADKEYELKGFVSIQQNCIPIL